ncbi:MAG: hypothetical protein GY782_06185 [Gammaproteobacteria bacterium]|nr:hypothetical protein [Gammaproteobacteria bacterium]
MSGDLKNQFGKDFSKTGSSEKMRNLQHTQKASAFKGLDRGGEATHNFSNWGRQSRGVERSFGGHGFGGGGRFGGGGFRGRR